VLQELAKTAERIEVPFGKADSCRTRKDVLEGIAH